MPKLTQILFFGFLIGLSMMSSLFAQNADIARLQALSQKNLNIDNSSNDILVAVIDTGIDIKKNPQLINNIVKDKSGQQVGIDFVDEDNSPQDKVGHGTHVSGIIIDQLQKQKVSNFKILPIKYKAETDNKFEAINTILGLDAAVLAGVKVINFSLDLSKKNKAIEQVFKKLQNAGIIVVVAAGNSGMNVDNNPETNLQYHFDNIIIVGSSDKKGRSVSEFSNYGSTFVDVFSDGEDILSNSLNGKNERLSGTSQAAPIVTARIVKIMSQHPELSYKDIIHLLLTTGTNDGSPAIISKGLRKYSRTGVFIPYLTEVCNLNIPQTEIEKLTENTNAILEAQKNQ